MRGSNRLVHTKREGAQMLSLSDYAAQDGLGLAELVAGKEVTPQELVDTAVLGIEKVNPRLNAVLQVLSEQAKAEIEGGLPQGPFTGVPFLIKELVLHAKNTRLDMGSRLAQGYVASEDSELMARFRRAGLVLVGTTQTPELGYNPTTSAEDGLRNEVQWYQENIFEKIDLWS